MTFLALAAVIAVGSAVVAIWVHGYWNGQRGPAPVDLDEPGLADVQTVAHVGGWTPPPRYHATPLEPGWLTRHARSRKRTA